jgi:hypothetical protein
MREWEAEDMAEQLIAKPPQHALAQLALIHVYDVLESAIRRHKQQEYATKYGQILHLLKFECIDYAGEIRSRNRLIDDQLGQFQ